MFEIIDVFHGTNIKLGAQLSEVSVHEILVRHQCDEN